jgi:hypothetical protein
MSVVGRSTAENSAAEDSAVEASAPNRAAADGPIARPEESLHLIAESSDMVEAAIDVLSARHQVSRAEAADLLTRASDDSPRSLGEVAKDVVLLGLPSISAQIELRPTPSPPPSPCPALSPLPLPAEAGPGPFIAERTTAEKTVPDGVAAALLEQLVAMSTLPDLLSRVSDLATKVVPGCEAAAVTVLREGAPAAVVSADSRARTLEQTQYRNGDGPYLEVARTQRPVRIDDITSVPTGGMWARAAVEAGFRAVLSVPIVTGKDTVATVSLYAGHADGWSRDSLAAAHRLADHAGHAIAVALRLMAHP